MTKGGWIMMLSYWGMIIALLIFCFGHVIGRELAERRKKSERKH